MLQAGSVVEEGTHDQLYGADESVYRSLVQLQEQATDKRAALALDLEAAAAADEEAAASTAAEVTRQRCEQTRSATAGSTGSLQLSLRGNARDNGPRRRSSTRDSLPLGRRRTTEDDGGAGEGEPAVAKEARDDEEEEDKLVRRHVGTAADTQPPARLRCEALLVTAASTVLLLCFCPPLRGSCVRVTWVRSCRPGSVVCTRGGGLAAHCGGTPPSARCHSCSGPPARPALMAPGPPRCPS